jgi:hypothetical protein
VVPVLTEKQLRALGRVSVHFNNLEYMTHTIVSALINLGPDIGYIVFEGESFDRMLDRLRRLNKFVFADDHHRRTWIEQWAFKANDVKKRRDQVLHAHWVLDQPTGEVVALRLSSRSISEGPCEHTN